MTPRERPRLPTLLVVDDAPDNLMLMSDLLQDDYQVRLADSGMAALEDVQSGAVPDLVLLDIMMPRMSGWDVFQALKDHPATHDVPVIFLTALSASEDEERGLAMGAADFISKPINPPVLRARVRTQLQNKAAADFLRDQNHFLESEVARRMHEVDAVKDITIQTLASLAETRDAHTGNHVRRTQHYVRALAMQLREHPRFSHYLTDRTIDLLFKSAPLHDIGKVGIPDGILLKPGRLTAQEYEIMKTHARLGRDAIANAERHLGFRADFLEIAKEITYGHHERWDGTGYPEGLAGDQIPISARLMAVADVYDALAHHRVYRNSVPPERAMEMIAEERGTHFDPDVVDAAVALGGTFRDIALQFAGRDDEP